MDALSFDDFDLFARVAATGSLSAVARERNIAPSNVSRSLARIEAACHLRLAHRTTHGLTLTDEGEVFLEHAQRILAEREQLHSSLGPRRIAVAGTVHIAVSELLAEHIVIPSLPRLQAAYPQLALELHVDDRLVRLAEQGIDIAVRAAAAAPETMVVRTLARFGRSLYAAPAYLKKHGVPRRAADLAGHVLISNTASPSQNRWGLQRQGEAAALQVQGQVRADSSAAVVALALAGTGIASLNNLIGKGLTRQGRLKEVLRHEVDPGDYTINAVILAERHRAPKIRATLNHLHAAFAAHAKRAA